MISSRSLSVALGAAVSLAFAATAPAGGNDRGSSTHPVAPDNSGPSVIHAVRHDVSAPMRDILRNLPPPQPMGTEEEPYAIPNILLKLTGTPTKMPEAARRSLVQGFEAVNDSQSARAAWYIGQTGLQELCAPEQARDAIMRVTREDVIRVAQGVSYECAYLLVQKGETGNE
jgi:hypothetical protein